MLFICTSQSTMLSENVPLHYDNYEEIIFSWNINTFWVVTVSSVADRYWHIRAPSYCEQRQQVPPKCRFLLPYPPTRTHGITLENRYVEKMGYGRQYSD